MIFYSTTVEVVSSVNGDASNKAIPTAAALGQLGGKAVGVSGRIKDFIILDPLSATDPTDPEYNTTVVTGSSDGTIRLWQIRATELVGTKDQKTNNNGIPTHKHPPVSSGDQTITQGRLSIRQIGRLLGTYETGNRITCLTAFVLVSDREDMNGSAVQAEESAYPDGGEDEDDDNSKDD